MSDTSSSGETGSAMGRGTGGGGGLHVPPPPTPPQPASIVTNQQLLVLDKHGLTDLPREAARAIKFVELEFARDVSALAVAAYDRIIEQLRASDVQR